MKVTSALLTTMSGKIGGAVASKSRGDVQYFRKLVTPSNPNTFMQKAARDGVSSAAAYWQGTLSEANQELWWDIASGSQTGQTLFSKVNQPRIFANNSLRATGGTIFNVVEVPPDSISTPFTTPATPIVIDDSANTMVVAGINADDPWNADTVPGDTASGLFVYASHQQNASRFKRQHPYQLVAVLARQEGDPAVTTGTINLAPLGFTTIAGKIMYVKMYAVGIDGAVSGAIEQRVVITA